MNKKKILFVGSFKELGSNGNSGGQMFACKSLLGSSLSERVEWILIDSTADSNISNSLHVRIIKAVRRIFMVIFYLTLKKVDIALIFTSNGGSFLEKGLIAYISKSFRVKVIIAPRSGFIKQDIENKGFMKVFIKFIFRKSDFIICQGKKWQTYFIEKTNIPKEKLVVIQNWIDVDNYHFEKNQQQVINILFLAWVDKNKGIFELIEALKTLNTNYNYVLNIAGDGSAMNELIIKISEFGLNQKIKIHGWVNGIEKFELLKKTDIFILPSYSEGFPNALLESMACGIACIATNVGSISDLIINEENGLLIPPKNANSIAQALSNLIENPDLRLNLGRNAHKSVEINNSIESAVKKFHKLFNLA